MKPVNIYALTRLKDPELLSKLERQMSGRGRFMKIRGWEIEGLALFCERLMPCCKDVCAMTFYFSYTMSKLGKEFDLLRISDDRIVNIELKSGGVPDEAIRNQLIQNRYYLSTLGKPVYYYTFISSRDRLVRLSNSGKLVESNFEELGFLLDGQEGIFEGDIEDLFKEDKYLISPITDPGRFLRKEYFLTFQQRDIKKQILKNISAGSWQGFTGLPGTGKTILLYDIAMNLSCKTSVCIFHFGSHREELEQLNDRLKRIDFYYCDKDVFPDVLRSYSVIFIDEGHLMKEAAFLKISEYSRLWGAPVIISYDNVDCVSESERLGTGASLFEKLDDFRGYKLTNKIRLNSELSYFLRTLFSSSKIYKRDYPHVSVSYGNDLNEAMNLIRYYEKEGFVFIWDKSLGTDHDRYESFPGEVNVRLESGMVTGKEFDRVVMLIDASFYYDEYGYLRNTESEKKAENARIMNLFHGLSRAKKKIALVIMDNYELMERVYQILQKA